MTQPPSILSRRRIKDRSHHARGIDISLRFLLVCAPFFFDRYYGRQSTSKETRFDPKCERFDPLYNTLFSCSLSFSRMDTFCRESSGRVMMMSFLFFVVASLVGLLFSFSCHLTGFYSSVTGQHSRKCLRETEMQTDEPDRNQHQLNHSVYRIKLKPVFDKWKGNNRLVYGASYEQPSGCWIPFVTRWPTGMTSSHHSTSYRVVRRITPHYVSRLNDV